MRPCKGPTPQADNRCLAHTRHTLKHGPALQGQQCSDETISNTPVLLLIPVMRTGHYASEHCCPSWFQHILPVASLFVLSAFVAVRGTPDFVRLC